MRQKWAIIAGLFALFFLVVIVLAGAGRVEKMTARPAAAAPAALPGQPLHQSPAYRNQHPWPMAGREQLRSGYGNVLGPAFNPVQPAPWPYPAGAALRAAPVIGKDGVAYAGAEDGKVRALVASAGTTRALLRWEREAGGPVYSALALKEEVPHAGAAGAVRVFAATAGGQLTAYDAATGDVAWATAVGGPVAATSHPAVRTNYDSGLARLYLATDAGIYALAEHSGGSAVYVDWQDSLNTANAVALSPGGGRLYATRGSNLYVFDAYSGARFCSLPLGSPLTAPVVHPQGMVFVGTEAGELLQVASPCNNPAVEDVVLGAPVVQPPALAPDERVMVLAGTDLVAVDWPARALLWVQDVFPAQPNSPVVDGRGSTFIVQDDGTIDGWAADGSLLFQEQVAPGGAAVTAPAIDGSGRLYLGADEQVVVVAGQPAYQLAYQATRFTRTQDIYLRPRTYSSNGDRWHAVDANAVEAQPAFSLDGRQMAYLSDLTGVQAAYLANAGGASPQNVSDFGLLAGYDVLDPAFSPVERDGTSRLPAGDEVLALTRDRSSSRELFFVDLAYLRQTGTVSVTTLSAWFQQEIGNNPESWPNHAQMAFSPDGDHVAYTVCQGPAGEREEALVLVRLRGGPPNRTVVASYLSQSGGDCGDLVGFHPAFSPTGDHLVYQSGSTGVLYQYDVVTHQSEGIFHSAFGSGIRAFHPTWSPDGVQIAFAGVDSSSAQAIHIKNLAAHSSDPGAVVEPDPSAHPVFHPLRLPVPFLGSAECGSAYVADTIVPERAQPRDPVRVLGCGLDLLFPERNRIDFAAVNGEAVPADIYSHTLDLGGNDRGLLTTLAPYRAGDGPITATNPFGAGTSEPFTVIPLPVLLEPQQAKRLEQIRIVGFGMEHADESAGAPWENEVYFTNNQGNIAARATISATGVDPCGSAGVPCPGTYSGLIHWLDVVVPPEAVTGTVGVDNADGDRGLTPQPFELIRNPADLAVRRVDAPACNLLVGGSGDYVYEVENNGPNEAARTKLEIGLPTPWANVAVTAGSGTCSTDATGATCDLGTLSPFATEQITVALTATGKTMAQTVAEVDNAFLDPDGTNNVVTHTVRFQGVNTSTLDIAIADVEVTQGLQDLNQSIQLIEDKPTVVRVYLDSGGVGVKQIPVLLYETDGSGNRLGAPIYPDLPGGATCYEQQSGPRQRNLSNNSANFTLGPGQLSGTFNFEVVVDEGGILPETDRTNNTFSSSVQFFTSADICLVSYPIRNLGNDGDPTNDVFDLLGNRIPVAQPDANILLQNTEFLTRAASLLPTAELQVYPRSGIIAPNRNPFIRRYHLTERDVHGGIILNRLATWRRNSLTPQACYQNNWPTHYLGMADEDIDRGSDPSTVFNGLGHRPGQEILVRFAPGLAAINSPWGGRTLAHELGHNFDRQHVNCPASGGGSPDNPDPNYPYNSCNFGPADPAGYFGTDVTRPLFRSFTVISPTAGADIMSYGAPRWTSDYTWNAIYNQLPGSGQPTAPIAAGQTVTEVYDITGIISGTDTLEPTVLFDPIYQVDTSVMPPEKMAEALAEQPASATYTLTLLNSSEEILASAPFTPTPPSDPLGPVTYLSFDLLLPYEPGGARFQLLHGDQELGSLPISPQPPTVTVTLPEGGEAGTTLEVAWQGSDPDGDTLFYMVQYSWDGGNSWEVLNLDLLSSTLSISTTYMIGNNEPTALVRVLATDGANTSSDVSLPFEIPRHQPEVYVNRPAAGAVITTSAPTLYGNAYDAEDGPLGDALHWFVEGPGLSESGTGRELPLKGLAPGAYELLLEVTDSDGQDAFAYQTFTVAACVDPAAPLPEVAQDGDDLLLSWSADESQRSFVVYRSDEPYFNPDTATEIGSTVEDFFQVIGAANNTAYYYVEALGCDGHRVVTPAGQRGAFTFELEVPQ